MIIGIGTDIVDINRIAKLLEENGEKFITKVFNAQERTTKTGPQAAAHYAKRFAAKEAIAKAIGQGIGELNFKHITVQNHESGQPYAVIKGSNAKIHLSMSDEFPYAVAYAVIES